MQNANQCRERATQYLAQAVIARSARERVRLEELAVRWQRLASNLEMAMAMSSSPDPLRAGLPIGRTKLQRGFSKWLRSEGLSV
jgi:hypothetical protein